MQHNQLKSKCLYTKSTTKKSYCLNTVHKQLRTKENRSIWSNISEHIRHHSSNYA